MKVGGFEEGSAVTTGERDVEVAQRSKIARLNRL